MLQGVFLVVHFQGRGVFLVFYRSSLVDGRPPDFCFRWGRRNIVSRRFYVIGGTTRFVIFLIAFGSTLTLTSARASTMVLVLYEASEVLHAQTTATWSVGQVLDLFLRTAGRQFSRALLKSSRHASSPRAELLAFLEV